VFALSLKQPWAALLVSARKSIEVRSWVTSYRGPLLIHASQQIDDREWAWKEVTDEILPLTKLQRGIIGQVQLDSIKPYHDLVHFEREASLHLNHPDWFVEGRLFGWSMKSPSPVPFHPCPGNVRLFNVTNYAPPQRTTHNRLLVSVRSIAEAEIASEAKVDLIDLKEPDSGSLGRADPSVIRQILEMNPREQLVSVALGELASDSIDLNLIFSKRWPNYVKFGLAGMRPRDWREELNQVRSKLPETTQLVVVAYVDDEIADSPSVDELVQFSIEEQYRTILFDTYEKKGKRLTNWIDHSKLETMIRLVQSEGIQIALAGSLDADAILKTRDLKPDWFAVRGAVCHNGDRKLGISLDRIHQLKSLLRPTSSRSVLVRPPEG
jgi:(5-formylfuran-3-yl)methyl phosphate synthase